MHEDTGDGTLYIMREKGWMLRVMEGVERCEEEFAI